MLYDQLLHALSHAGTVPVGEFVDANWYAAWAVDPLLVAAHRGELGRCQHAATLLATDQVSFCLQYKQFPFCNVACRHGVLSAFQHYNRAWLLVKQTCMPE
eukprot:GHRR01016338.1.p3 GENE.GHRR01016338.1~~GHRR01016338.1.p3  ORF type:complete len:101 (-),score=18.06 GHRR01016338.1:1401-1703(-)